jgi:serine/threonine protein phosphatase PrpC
LKQGYGYRSDQMQRKDNQDTLGVFELSGYRVLVVCDGMGGHAGGAHASALAVRTVYDELSTATGDPRADLKRAVEVANRTIFEAARKNYKLNGMGTTIVAVVIADDVAHIAHVGDSRVYLLREGKLRAVTRDHTMVNLFVDAELLSPEDASTHPEAHVLSRSLGVERDVEVELGAPLRLLAGDRLLLTSDGVHGPVGDALLEDFDWSNPQTGVNETLKAVHDAGGDDNATIVAFAMGFEGASAPTTSVPNPDGPRSAEEGQAQAVVKPITATPIYAENGPAQDVTTIEELDDLPSDLVPRIATRARSEVDLAAQRRVANRRAAVSLGGLAVVGALFAVAMFRAPSGRRALPVEPATPADATEQVAEVPVAEAVHVAPEEAPPVVPTEPEPAEPSPSDEGAAGDEVQAEQADPEEPVAEAPEEVPAEEEAPAPEEEPASAEEPTTAAATITPPPPAPPDEEPVDDDAVAAVEAPPPPVARVTQPPPAASAADVAEEVVDGAEARPRYAPAAYCVDCSSSFALPTSAIYLTPTDEPELAVAFFAPKLPKPPRRMPHAPLKYEATAPRGPAQAEAIRQARSQECAGSVMTVREAIGKSVDYAVLYRTAWFCFNDTHQNTLANAEAETFEAFVELLDHFEGPKERLVAPASGGDPANHTYSWTEPATDGLEYRLSAFESDVDLHGFRTVVLDLLGAPAVADHLGADILLEAQAAASASRMESPSPAAIDVWARRVFVATSAMNGPVGEMVREHRPELAQSIDGLLLEATGGDAGRLAVAASLTNTFVPREVAKAQALALGRPVPAALENEEDGSKPVASSRRPAPTASATSSTSGSRGRATPGPDGTVAAREPEEPEDGTPREGLTIKVYKSLKRPAVRGEP